MKILISASNASMDGMSDAHVARIRETAGNKYEVVVTRLPEEHLLHAADADIVFGLFNKQMFQVAKRVKWVQTDNAGIDGLMFSEFQKSPITLLSAKGTVGTHLAEHAYALLLGVLRGIGEAVRARGGARGPASRTDLVYGSHLLEEGKVPDGLAYLVRAARNDPENRLIASRLLSSLASHNFYRQQGKPLALPSPVMPNTSS